MIQFRRRHLSQHPRCTTSHFPCLNVCVCVYEITFTEHYVRMCVRRCFPAKRVHGGPGERRDVGGSERESAAELNVSSLSSVAHLHERKRRRARDKTNIKDEKRFFSIIALTQATHTKKFYTHTYKDIFAAMSYTKQE